MQSGFTASAPYLVQARNCGIGCWFINLRAGWRIHVSVNYVIIGSDNGLSSTDGQVIIQINVSWSQENKNVVKFESKYNTVVAIQENNFENVESKYGTSFVAVSKCFKLVVSLWHITCLCCTAAETFVQFSPD